MQARSLCFSIAVVLLCAHAYAQTLVLQGTVRDMAPVTMIHSNYPADWWKYNGWIDAPTQGGCGTANGGKGFNISMDFEMPLWWYGNIQKPNAAGGILYNGEKGLVGPVCEAANGWTNCARTDADRKPIYAYKGKSPLLQVQSPESFWTWFHDNPAVFAVAYDITLKNIGGRLYKYETEAFFPIDGKGWNDWNVADDQVTKHNYGYCFEAHGHFTYYGGEVFQFIGDDDVWVYLDNRLVIDLGGVHTEQTASISLDNIAGLSKGSSYKFDFFYCERHTTLSKMSITTSINISCTYFDWCDVCEGDGQSCCTGNNAMLCDDGDACTVDKCAVLVPPTQTCIHTPIKCDDGNMCTNEYCDKIKGCVSTPISPCNDNNACTVDTCNNATGCSYAPRTCTGGDKCNPQICDKSKGCIPDTPTNCDDGNVCTVDKCDPVSGCTHTPVTCPSDKCTNSVCDKSKGCLNTTITCNDNNKCTLDSCVPATGCQFVTVPCNDNNACTSDSCDPSAGCQYQNITCPAGNKCQTVQCDAKAGCIYPSISCDDNNACTIDKCDPTTGCVRTPVNCDDNNKCTDDACDPVAGCTHKPISCNDFDACTNDTCSPTQGCLHPRISCDDGDACTIDKCDSASGCQYAKKDCNDNNPCTADSCNPSSGCVYTPSPCDRCNTTSGLVKCAPTGGDYCFPVDCDPATGACTITRSITCTDNNLCTDDKCVNGTCQFPAISCDDGKPCTRDSCDPKTGCKHDPIICDDNNPCTDDVCNGTGNCVYTPKTCATTDLCNPMSCNRSTGACVGTPVVCNDDNNCTDDTCATVGGKAQCVYTPKNCGTTDLCNPLVCVPSGSCVPKPVVCNDNNNCTTDACVVRGGVAVCDFPAVVCTTTDACAPQSCNPSNGACITTPINCDDGNNCTKDFCANGTCQNQPGACQDFGLCIPALCDPKLGCQPAPSICDDNNPCTIDTCIGPMQCNNTLTACDDDDDCTIDSCSASSATVKNCTYTPRNCSAVATQCQVYVGCTKDGGCQFTDKQCPEPAEYCKTMICDELAGCVTIDRPCIVDDPDCYIGQCDNDARECKTVKRDDFATARTSQHGGVTCFAYYNKEETAAAIAGGIIAAIVVAAVIFAVLAALGARQAYIWASLRGGAMGGANVNPMYAPSAANKNNPLFGSD